MSINIRHLFLTVFVVWAEVVRIGKTYRLEPTCILAVLNDESVFATFFCKASLHVWIFLFVCCTENTSFSQVVWKTEVSVTSSSEIL